MKKVAYYKGCLASLSAKELDFATQALAPKVGLELIELESVTCCGAGDIHEAEPDYYLHLNARILSYAAAEGVDTLLTVCNVCTLNLRQANFVLMGDSEVRARVNENLVSVGVPAYERNIDVRHLLWEIAEGEGYELLKSAAHRGLKGLKIAPFYGCQILRPSKINGFEDPDRPWSLERIIEACGGEAIDYPAKIKCCGFPIIQAREETALGELIQPIEQAYEAGADAIVTPCPLCHLSLDAWQSKLKAATGRDFKMPILHLSQLVGVAAGRRGGGAEVQAARRLGAAGPREAPDLTFLWIVVALAALVVAYGAFEAGWVRLRTLELRGRRAAGRARRPADRASLRLPPRAAVARRARDRARGRLGRGAPARPRLHHRRPRLAQPRRASARARCSSGCPQATYVVLGNHDFAISRDPFSQPVQLVELARGTAPLRRVGRGRCARRARRDRGRRSAVVARQAVERRSGRPTRRSGSCSATSRACSTASRTGAGT